MILIDAVSATFHSYICYTNRPTPKGSASSEFFARAIFNSNGRRFFVRTRVRAAIRAMLEKQFGANMDSKKNFIKEKARVYVLSFVSFS